MYFSVWMVLGAKFYGSCFTFLLLFYFVLFNSFFSFPGVPTYPIHFSTNFINLLLISTYFSLYSVFVDWKLRSATVRQSHWPRNKESYSQRLQVKCCNWRSNVQCRRMSIISFHPFLLYTVIFKLWKHLCNILKQECTYMISPFAFSDFLEYVLSFFVFISIFFFFFNYVIPR